MPAVRHHRQRRAGDRLLHQQSRRQAWPILIAGQDQRRQGQRLHLIHKVVQRGPLALHTQLRVARAERRVLRQHARELGEPTRVLVLELHTRWAIGILRREDLHPLFLDECRDSLCLSAELLGLSLLRAVAAPRDAQRQRTRRMAEAIVQRGEPAHRQSDNMRLVDLQMIQHRPDVVRRSCLRILRHILGHIGWWIATRIVGNGTITLAEMPHLRLPASIIAGVFVHEDNWPARAGFFVVKAHSVISHCVRHRYPLWCGFPPARGRPTLNKTRDVSRV